MSARTRGARALRHALLGESAEARAELQHALAGADAPLRRDLAPLRWALHEADDAIADLESEFRAGDDAAGRLAVDLAARSGFDPQVVRLGRALLEKLVAPDPTLLRLVAAPLARVGLQHAVPFLTTSLQREEDPESRAALLALAGARGDLAAVRSALRPTVPEEVAVRALADAGEPRALERWQDLDPIAKITAEGERLLEAGDTAAGRARLDDALRAAGGYHFPALLLRLRSEMAEDLARSEHDPSREQTQDRGDRPLALATEVREGLVDVFGHDRLVDQDLAGIVRVLDEAIERLGTSRSPICRVGAHDGRRRLGVRTSPREASRATLERVRALRPEEVRAAFDVVAARYPESESWRVHRGELALWCGDHDAADEDFRAALAIQPGTRWAWIGRAAVAMLRGDVEESLALHEEGVRVLGSEIGSIFVYRGEARLRAGDRVGARADLERAVQLHPRRLGARLNRALLRLAEGEDASEDLTWIRANVPLLLVAAGGPDVLDGANEPARVQTCLETARELSRGNRSSSCPTFVGPHGFRLLTLGDDPDRRRRVLLGLRRHLR